MTTATKRLGALALTATMLVTGFAAFGSGATAQDRVLASTPATQAETTVNGNPVVQDPEIRFVAREVVQDIPEEPEAPTADDMASRAESLRQLVALIDSGEIMSREIMCLAQAVYFESRGEPLAGQLAVARVVVNRADSSTFPDDYCAVVTQRAQFSFVRAGRIPSPNRSSAAWARARAIARIAHGDLWESAVDDSLYFHATHVRPGWSRRLARRAQIDNHIFYR